MHVLQARIFTLGHNYSRLSLPYISLYQWHHHNSVSFSLYSCACITLLDSQKWDVDLLLWRDRNITSHVNEALSLLMRPMFKRFVRNLSILFIELNMLRRAVYVFTYAAEVSPLFSVLNYSVMYHNSSVGIEATEWTLGMWRCVVWYNYTDVSEG